MPVALTAVLLALGGEAVAVRVNYDAPAECPSAAAFYDAVRARTEHARPAVGEEPRLDVTVRVTREPRGFSGEVREVVNGKESAVRSMDGETCKEVVEALSLTVALSIDPNAHAPSPTPVSAPPAPPPQSTRNNAECEEVINRPPAAVVAPVTAGAPLRLELGLGALGTLVDSDAFSFGGTVSATVLREVSPSTSSSVQLGFLFASNGLGSTPADHRAHFGALALDACPWRHRLGDVELAPCAMASFGVLEVTGREVSDAKTVDRAWWSAGLDAQLAWLLGQGWVLEGALGGSVPLVRRRYFTSNAEHVVAETPRISPLVRFGVGFRF
ncbi:MAG: hypothetical protein ABW061_07875 [Polyangiaceae bacterium]